MLVYGYWSPVIGFGAKFTKNNNLNSELFTQIQYFGAITGSFVASDFSHVKSSEFFIMGKYKGSNL